MLTMKNFTKRVITGIKSNVYSSRNSLHSESNLQKPTTTKVVMAVDATPSLKSAIQAATDSHIENATAIDVEKAVRHRNITCPRKKLQNGEYEPWPIWNMEMGLLRRYGLGTFMWFYTLKSLGLIFAMMTLLSIPQFLVFNSSTCNIFGTLTAIQSLSLGNFFSTPRDFSLNLFGTNLERPAIELGLASWDALCALIFWLVMLMLKRNLDKIETDYNTQAITVRRFSVMVTNVPPLCFSRDEYAQYFTELFGVVTDVSICFNDSDLVEKYLQRAALKKRLQTSILQKKTEETESFTKKLDVIDNAITSYKTQHPLHAVAVFVTFDDQESMKACENTFKRTWFSCCLHLPHLRFLGHRITVKKAVEPSNILFQNLKYRKSEVRSRRLLTAMCSVLVLLFSIGVLFGVRLLQEKIVKATFFMCTANDYSNFNVTGTEAQQNCYCAKLSAIELSAEPWLGKCASYINKRVLTSAVTILNAVTIVLVNAFSTYTVTKVAAMEKHISLTNEQRSIARNLFIILFVNTGVVILLVNIDPRGIPLYRSVDSRKEMLAFSSDSSGYSVAYRDFTPDWYSNVGFSIVTAIAINMFMPHFGQLLDVLLGWLRRGQRWCYKYKACFKEPNSQAELNSIYSGKSFRLAERYAILVAMVYVVLMFSAAMPVLYLFAAVTCFMVYWCDKASFLRLYSVPPRFDAALSKQSMSIMQSCVMLHAALAMWQFSTLCDGFQSQNNLCTSKSYNEMHPSTATMSSPWRNRTCGCASFEVGDPMLGYDSSFVSSVQNVDSLWDVRILQWNMYPGLALLGLLVTRRLIQELLFCYRIKAQNAQSSGQKVTAMTHTMAKKSVRMESYHLWRQNNYADAYMKTASQKMLEPEYSISGLEEDMDYVPMYFTSESRYAAIWSRLIKEGKTPDQILPQLQDWEKSDTVRKIRIRKCTVAVKKLPEPSEPYDDEHTIYLDHTNSNVVGVDCPNCHGAFNIYDTGKEAVYHCPYCKAAFSV